MRIAIFGASGATGQLLTERSLAAGYDVTALVRNPQVFPYRNRVRIVQGSAVDGSTVLDTVRGTNAVLSALGSRSLRKENLLERAVPLIVSAMNELGVRRIIVLGAAGALPSSLEKQSPWRRWFTQTVIFNTILKYPMASQVSQYATLSTSGLDWTMVMPPMLTNGPARGSYRIDGEALPQKGTRISRADVADFMMQQLSTDQWKQKGVYLSW
jgi:putative NADH-flavin reductase